MKLSNKKVYSILTLTLLLSFFFVSNFCSAALLNDNAQKTIDDQADDSALLSYDIAGSDMYDLVQTVINAFLGIIGVILLIYMLYAGYEWMTARGEEEKVEKAKDTLKRAITGAIIIVGAYAISIFVMARLQNGTLKNSNSAPTSSVNQQSVTGGRAIVCKVEVGLSINLKVII